MRVFYHVIRLAIFPLVVLALASVHTAQGVSANPEVVGNQEQVRYEGTGGLILPESVDHSTRRMVSECLGCSWKMTPACIPGPGNYCDAAIRACPSLIDHVRTWFRPVGGEWVETGLICLSTQHISTVTNIGREITSHFEQYVPELKPRCWPHQRVVTQIPIICESGQSSEVHNWNHHVAGYAIRVSSKPHWVWNFAGVRLVTDQPGDRYPDASVSHTFTRHGSASMSVQSVWSGTYSVGDLGPFEIREDLRQFKGWDIDVGEARSRLVRPSA